MLLGSSGDIGLTVGSDPPGRWVVANLDGRCKVAPPAIALNIVAAMTNSPDVKIEMVSSRISCSSGGSRTPHG
jgi:hypothetical protein